MTDPSTTREHPAANASPAAADFPELRAALGPRLRLLQQGRVGVDGFHGGGFDAKLERERRYGEVYTFDEHRGGCLLRLELPRQLPDSAAKRSLGAGDVLPDHVCTATVAGNLLTVRGCLGDPDVRRVAAYSPAFPPDFHTEIPLPPAAGWRVASSVADKVLEVVLLRR